MNLSATQSTGFKGIAILMVIALHLLSGFSLYKYQPLASTIDQISRLCVPLFIFLSAYGFSIKYSQTKLIPHKFLYHSLSKVIPLYLLWSLISITNSYLLYDHTTTLPQIFTHLIHGSADYHFYFVPLIIKFYFLFIIFHFIPTKFLTTLTILSFIFQIYLYTTYANPPIYLSSDQQQYATPISWIFYFLLGITLTRTKLPTISPKFLIIASTLSLTTAIYIALNQYTLTSDLIYSHRFTRLPILLYVTATIPLLQYLPNYSILQFLGRHSYLIYLSHVLALRLIQTLLALPLTPSIIISILITLLGIIISLKPIFIYNHFKSR